MAAQLPVNVSPLIKGARWTLLTAGVLYGMARYKILMRKEKIRLEHLERTRPEREAKMALEKEMKIKMEEELVKQIVL